MKNEDIEEMKQYISGYFSESWKLIKGVLGEGSDENWQALVNKSNEWLGVGQRILSTEEFKSLTAKEQVTYEAGRFLFTMSWIMQNVNDTMRKWDGENVDVKGARYEPRKV